MQKIIYIFLYLLLLTFPIFSQIEISVEEHNSYWTLGRSYNFNVDYDHSQWDIGSPGGGNSWDFSAAETAKQTLFSPTMISASGTPFHDMYPLATVVEYSNVDSIIDENTTVNYKRYSYYKKTALGIYDQIGLGEITTTNNTSLGVIVLTNTETYTHSSEEFLFPLMFDMGWAFADTFTVMSKWGDEPYSEPRHTHYFDDTLHVDAWGTIKLPNGKVTDALRVRHYSEGTSPSIFQGFPPTLSKTSYYRFYTKSDGYLFVSADNDNAAHSGAVEGTVSWIDENINSSVEKLESIPTEFSLKQNYPNPFNPSTRIEYSIAEPSFVKLIIYDILGNKVSELVGESQTSGNYRYEFDGSNLSSGTYFIHLQAGELRQVRKMILMK